MPTKGFALATAVTVPAAFCAPRFAALLRLRVFKSVLRAERWRCMFSARLLLAIPKYVPAVAGGNAGTICQRRYEGFTESIGLTNGGCYGLWQQKYAWAIFCLCIASGAWSAL
ncbi:hypothetical protein NPIL_456741 [Nephila pilipes]|uniref:Uncharacterized protein n=1 Tax=Nephila pilipes TaxID=299642 RepID=A0A8X6QY14_NEPPI|nr:hypothetical protein NPIL_456741 [Nephila pilipes]